MPEQYIGLGNRDPLALLQRLVELGLTNVEIAKIYELAVSTFQDMLKAHPEIQRMMEKTRMRPNFMVEQALFKRALGFKIREVTIQDGRPTKLTVKEAFPDVTAQIFWLKNRDPERWKDVMDINVSLRDRMARAHAARGSVRSSSKDDEDTIDV